MADEAEDLTPVYEDAGRRYGIDPALLRAQTHVESTDNDYAISPAGAEGRSQFLPSTAARIGLHDPFDPREAIPAQAKLLRQNMDQFDSPEMAIAAYHGGTDPSSWGPKTRDYLQKVAQAYSSRRAVTVHNSPPSSELRADDDDWVVPPQQTQHEADDWIVPGQPQARSKQALLPPALTEDQAPLPQPQQYKPSYWQLQTPPQQPQEQPGPTGYAAELQRRHEALAAVGNAAKEGWQTSMWTPYALQLADKYGLGGDARALDAVFGTMNAAFAGGIEAAHQVVRGLGLPETLARDAAAMVESAGMTGGPHIPMGEGMRAATEGREMMGARPQPAPPPPAGPRGSYAEFERRAQALAGAQEPQEAGAPSPVTGQPPQAPGAAEPPRSWEQAALDELDPEEAAAVEKHNADLEKIAEEAGIKLPPWQKPGLREQPPATPPTEPLAEPVADNWIEFNRKGAVGLADQLGLTYQLGNLARAGKTAKEISEALNGRLSPDEVRAVRDSLGIAPAGPSGFAFGPDIPQERPASQTGVAPQREPFGPPAPPWQKPSVRELERFGPPEAFGPPAPEVERAAPTEPAGNLSGPSALHEGAVQPTPPEEVTARPPSPQAPDVRPRLAEVSANEAEIERAGEQGREDPHIATAEYVARKLDEDFAPGIKAFSPRELQDYAASVYGKKLSEGLARDVIYDAQELGVNRFIQKHPERFDPAADAETAKRMAADLAAVKDRLPTQTVRAGEKDTHQQFSTPPDYAYAAAWAANLRPEDRVIEPSAGTGSLAVMAQNAKVAEVTANEISEKRRNMLSHLNVDRLTAEDARQLHNALPDEIKPTAVLMNPPFSAAPGRLEGKRVLMEGASHVKAALDRLEPGGRLVAIVGRGMGMDAPAFRDWWKQIGSQYDVRANVGVGGGIYRKYGTNFATRLLVIDKMPPSHQAPIGGEVSDAASLIDKLQGVRDDRPIQQVASEPGRAEMAPTGEAPRGPGSELPGTAGVVGAGERPANPEPEQPQPAGRPGRGERAGTETVQRPEPGGEREPVDTGEPGRPAGGNEEPHAAPGPSELPDRSVKTGGGDDSRADGSGERTDPGVTEAEPITIATEKAVTDPADTGISEAVYENYKPQRLNVPGSKEHPGALVQSAAMASVLPPEPTYAPKIPKALVTSGGLSNAQLEAVVYAGQAHNQTLPNGARRGFFIGDGTGVGKGREIAGIILDNVNQGRGKHIWISETGPLVNDARRDWSGLGRDKNDIFELGKIKAGEPIKGQKGILFTTYATLRSSEQIKNEAPKPGEEATTKKFSKGKSRVDQIADWFGKDYDGVIVFDEAHNLGNATAEKGKRGTKQASAQALAGVELQNKLPNARVVYVSATGATELSNLAYAERLGLWGEGTAFANRGDFLSKMSQGGIAAMELVARDMKALGHYTARNLSYDGVDYDRVEHVLNPDQRQVYDKLAEGWQVVLQNFQAALEETGAHQNSDRKSAVLSAFWGGHQRFFNQIITSLQMPSVLKAVEKDLKEGRQAVLQLVNTNEASLGRALEKADPKELEDLDMTPRDQLMQLVEKAYPTQEFETYVDENGNERSRPVTDSAGNPVHNKAMLEKRDQLLDQLGSIRVPDGPMEMLLNHFGTDKVAEVTGRKQRVVRKADDEGQMKTVVEQRPGSSNVTEANAFQDGKKPILVFSQAGGTGRSYHADNNAPSAGARRSHYLVQPGWRADKAVQGFGRTHRTNQASAPIFHLVQTDLQGQKRFISSIARRLAQLGAITKGERKTGDQGLFSMKDNLESPLAEGALHQLFRDVHRGEVEGLTMETLEKGMGLKLVDPTTGSLRSDLPPMPQFLNRLLSLKINDQNKVFQEFGDRFDTAIDRATSAGTLDTGVETYKADKIDKKGDQVVYTDPTSGAETRHVHLEVQNKTNPRAFQSLRPEQKDFGFVQNNRSGRIYALAKATSYTDKDGGIVEQYRLTSPNSYQFVDRERVDRGHDNWTPIEDPAKAREMWDRDVANTPEYMKSDLHLVTGAVLPIWDRLGGNPKVFRLQTDAGERMLGRVVPNKQIASTLERLGAGQVKSEVAPADIAKRILEGGERIQLANDWTLTRRTVSGEPRIELTGPSFMHDEELKRAGVFKERIGYQTRYFIPTGDQAAAAIERITKSRPVVGMEGGREAPGVGGGEGGELYSFPGQLFSPAAWRRLLPARGNAGPYELLRDKTGIAKWAAEIKAGLAPTSLRGAKRMEYAIRGHTGESAQAYDIVKHRLDAVSDAVDRLPIAAQVDFTDRMEAGRRQATPELQRVADTLRSSLDEWAGRVQSLGRGYLANAIENYMGHIWGNYREWSQGLPGNRTQAQMQGQAIAGNVSKQPLRGSGAFLKQRKFPTQLEGINAGLVPVTYNPVKLQLIKIHEMQRFYHGTKLADQIKQQNLARWVRDSDMRNAQSEGLVALDDRIFQPKLYGVSPIGPVEPGKWMSPEPLARIFNRYMSEGLHGQSSIYDSIRFANNGLNSMQLAWPGFHTAFVTYDTMVSKAALALENAFRGEFGHSLKNIAGIPTAVFTSTYKGSQFSKAWLDPAGASPEMQKMVDAFKAGGFRFNMPDFWQSSASGPFFRHLTDLKHPLSPFYSIRQMWADQPTMTQKVLMTPVNIVRRAIDTMIHPVMGELVPRAKAGVFYDLAADWLRRNPTATPEELSAEMTKIQDSVDNRLGQLNYDNLFWNKVAKDLAFIMTRSVGWNLGTFRELGGAVVDAVTMKGLTHRLSYALMLPAITAIVGAITTKIATKQDPEGLDYFYPRTGSQDEQGNDVRVSIPGYLKDAIGFWHEPGQTVLNKTSPLMNVAGSLYKNRDYYGGSIYDAQHDESMAKAYADYLLGQYIPFSVQSVQHSPDATTAALALFGFNQAPKYITAPMRGERFQAREAQKAYRARQKETTQGRRVEPLTWLRNKVSGSN